MPSSALAPVPDRLADQATFLQRFNIEIEEYRRTGLSWRDLRRIYADYHAWWQYLRPAAQYVANILYLEPGVHAVSQRVKDPEHLIEKIIRKSRDIGTPWATPDNYRIVVKDLIGVRALHLFKEDWKTVHDSILKHWAPKPPIEAKVRRSDPQHVIDDLTKAGCHIEYLDDGYRSIHYAVEVQVARKMIIIEIQVRSLFEEAWGEVSHRVKYPYTPGSTLMTQYLLRLSVLAGIADSLSSAAKFLWELERAARTRMRPKILAELAQQFQARLSHVDEQSSNLQNIIGNQSNPKPNQSNQIPKIASHKKSAKRTSPS